MAVLWKRLFRSSIVPGPTAVRTYCCSHFIVSRESVHLRPLEFYEHALTLITTPASYAYLPDGSFAANRDLRNRQACQMMMWVWHVIFGADLDLPHRMDDPGLPLFLKLRNIRSAYLEEARDHVEDFGGRARIDGTASHQERIMRSNSVFAGQWQIPEVTEGTGPDGVFANECAVSTASGQDLCVVALSLYGSAPRYTQGAVEYAEMLPHFFPGWQLFIYTPGLCPEGPDCPVPAGEARRIEKAGGRFKQIPKASAIAGAGGMFWRFAAAIDPDVKRFAIRDADSRPSVREWAAVEEWIASGKQFHVMRDHPAHGRWAIPGGMWGAVRGALSEDDFAVGGFGDARLEDTRFLSALYEARVRGRALEHDSFSCRQYGARPFPASREQDDHVGAVFESGYVRDGFRELDVRKLQEGLEVQDRCCQDASVILWSNDFHISVIEDLKNLLSPLGVRVIDKSLSRHCTLTSTCAKDLRVITRNNGLELRDLDSLRRDFSAAYADDVEFKSANAFVCTYPPAMCELFMQFEKPMVVLMTIRYEGYREDVGMWQRWNQNLRKIYGSAHSVVAATCIYDQHYVEYFTGIRPVLLLSVCGQCPSVSQARHTDRQHEVLVGSIDRVHPETRELLMSQLWEVAGASRVPLEFIPLRNRYAEYSFEDLVSHPAIVHVPYQVSTMSFNEQYWLGLPLFFPSVNRLARWHVRFNGRVVNERTWAMVRTGIAPQGSKLRGHSSLLLRDSYLHSSGSPVPKNLLFDPNNETGIEAVRSWLSTAVFYTWPHVLYFDSWAELVTMLHGSQAIDLTSISQKMRRHALTARASERRKWLRILGGIRTHRRERGGGDCEAV